MPPILPGIGRFVPQPARGWKAVAVVGCGLAAAISICVAAWVSFRAPAPSAVEDDFAEAFSADGIFEVLQ